MHVFTFRCKQELDSEGNPRLGLFAEEVEVNPDLVKADANAKAYTVRYDAVIAMLLNEFLKEHRKVVEQQATITQLAKDFGATNCAAYCASGRASITNPKGERTA